MDDYNKRQKDDSGPEVYMKKSSEEFPVSAKPKKGISTQDRQQREQSVEIVR
jgi:hypothetical protein